MIVPEVSAENIARCFGCRRPAIARPVAIDTDAADCVLASIEQRPGRTRGVAATTLDLSYEPIDLASDLGDPVGFDRLVHGLAPRSVQVRSSNLWVGSIDDRTPAHFDRSHGLLVQLRGVKRVWLLGPRKRPPLPRVSATPTPNFSSSPRWLESTADAVVTLNPSDALYIPPFWWHQVLCESDAASVNIWWAASELELARASLRLFRRDVLRRALAGWELRRG